jgi:predicted DNA-binding transcriptional regulator AlpA
MVQIQLTLTLDETAAKTFAAFLAPEIKKAIGVTAGELEEKANARIRASQHALLGGLKLPENQGILVDSKEAAKLLKISTRTLWGMHNSGEMPQPIRIGRAVRWSLEVLKRWAEAGCPPVPKNS